MNGTLSTHVWNGVPCHTCICTCKASRGVKLVTMSGNTGLQSNAAKSVQPTVCRRFTDAQRITLDAYYRAGMKGVGARHLLSLQRCSREIGCSIEKVKASVESNK